MGNDDKTGDKVTPVTPTGRQMVNELARHSGAVLTLPKQTPAMMCQQGSDWSRGHSSIPQKLVQLVGHRESNSRPAVPLPQRATARRKSAMPSDTPIG